MRWICGDSPNTFLVTEWWVQGRYEATKIVAVTTNDDGVVTLWKHKQSGGYSSNIDDLKTWVEIALQEGTL